jgi:hypothetical protein
MINPRVARDLASAARTGANPLASVANTVGSEFLKTGGNFAAAAKQGVSEFVGSTGFGKALRAVGLFPDAVPQEISLSDANWQSNSSNGDWRVKLSLPSNFTTSSVMSPLTETSGLVFPYTPTIYITHSANYNQIQPVHSNYPFYAYQNSRVEQFSIVGDFYVETSKEAEYWVAAIHYLRAVTKMAYGSTSNSGSPPPVVRLNGYGDYVFSNVPVIVNSFAVELGQDIDYIKTYIGSGATWVPTRSNIQVTVAPIYSRRAVESFSLDRFVNGGYIGPNGGGFI